MAANPKTKVRACHILVKHRESRNPKSRNPAFKDVDITKRTVEEADAKLLEMLAQIKKSDLPPRAFKKMAKAHSDCGSYANAGDLGEFTFDQMLRPFSEATFGLKMGEISNVVHTDSGSHLIMRIPLDGSYPDPEDQ